VSSHPPGAHENAQSILLDTASRVFEIFGARPATGRVWAALYLSNEALDATQLSSMLGHSSGAVSMALADLVRFRFVYRHLAPKSRRQTYLAEPDLWVVLRQILTGEGLEHLRAVVASLQVAEALQKDALSHANEESKAAERLRLERLHHLLNVARFVLQTLLAAADRTRVELKAASKILSVTGRIGGEPLHRLRQKINDRHLAKSRDRA
jgi:DNA-binding transcriptional regulator GbsR (MarR family)